MVLLAMIEPTTNEEWLHHACDTRKASRSVAVVWLQSVTLLWMLIECGVALFAALRAHSPALLAFGSDSLVELLSACVVLRQFVPRLTISEERATRAAAVLLFTLTAIVTLIAVLSLMGKVQPEESPLVPIPRDSDGTWQDFQQAGCVERAGIM